MHLGEKIELALAKIGMTKAEFSRRVLDERGNPELTLSKQAVSGWIKTGRIDKGWVTSISKVLDVNIDWLLSEDVSEVSLPRLNGITSPSEGRDELRNRLMQPFIGGVTTDQLDDPSAKVWADVVDIDFSCGSGVDIEFHYTTLAIKQLSFEPSFFTKRGVRPENAKFAYVKGDSMQPFLFDGDIFGMDVTDTTIRDGQIYAVYFGGEAMLKQIFVEEDGRLTLHSYNPTWRDKTVNESNGSDFKVLGRQFWRAG